MRLWYRREAVKPVSHSSRQNVETRHRRLTVPDNIEQRNDIGCARKIAQHLYLPLDFVACHWLQDLDYTALAIDGVNPFEDLGRELESQLSVDILETPYL
jgi:hypothetical protein